MTCRAALMPLQGAAMVAGPSRADRLHHGPSRAGIRELVLALRGTALPPPAAVAGPTDVRRDTQTLAAEPIAVPGPVASAPGLAESEIDSAGDVLAGAPEVAAVPVYATRLPPAGQWRYRLQRGLVSGEAELAWAPQGNEHYELHLTGRVAGVTMLEWASQGRLDAAGVAPERLAIRRRGRDRQAVNFQREAGKITFSGPTHEVALLPGAQDRLSWIVQLSAVVAAAPERYGEGENIVLFVAGARGDADLWTFVVQGMEPMDGRPTLKLVREPRRRYDTRAEIWLDPAEHFVPLRLVQTPTGGGAALELQREREAR